MLKTEDLEKLRVLKKSLEPEIRPVSRPKGGFPDLASHLPRTQFISGAYSMTPYVQEPRESSGEYLGARYSPHPRHVNRTKKSYSIQ